MSAKLPSCVLCLYTVFIAYGEPQRFYAINADGSLSNVSFTSPVVDVIQPAEAIAIPPLPSCDSPPLQCIPPQQNGISAVYIPNEDNSSLILLEIDGEILRTYNIMSPCVFNDFALLSNFNNKPLLIACRLADNDSSINYALVDRYGTSDNRVMRVPGAVTEVVSPITVAIPRLDEGGASHSIVSITSQNNIIVYETDNFDGDIIMTSSYFPPCAPVRIQRQQRFINAFLLTCADGQLYLVNISIVPISFVSLPNSIMAIAHSAEYGLTIILSRSTATVTIQEILAQSAATRTIQLNTTVIYGANFGPDDKFAYVATDRGVVFINIDMALNGADKEFMYAMPTQLYSQGPPVVFLNNNTVAISSTSGQGVLLEFFYLWPWPPQKIISRTLNKQPRWYWFTPFKVIPGLPISPTDKAPDNSHDERLSDGAIAGITVAACVVVASIVMGTIVGMIILFCRTRNQEVVEPPADPDGVMDPVQNQAAAGAQGDHEVTNSQMVTGGILALLSTNTEEAATQGTECSSQASAELSQCFLPTVQIEAEEHMEPIQEATHAIEVDPSSQREPD